jgi:hypothetical protein
MWWTVLAIVIAILAVGFLLFGSQISATEERAAQSMADVNANKFWLVLGAASRRLS